MIYRVQIGVESKHGLLDGHGRLELVVHGTLTGAGSVLGGVMWDRGLPAPGFDNPRARFYFTEDGWRQVGRHVAAAGRQVGYVVQVIRRKNPRRSEIVFRDRLQVALLPNRRRG